MSPAHFVEFYKWVFCLTVANRLYELQIDLWVIFMAIVPGYWHTSLEHYFEIRGSCYEFSNLICNLQTICRVGDGTNK